MSEQERELAIFNLCKSLVDLLGAEQASANLQILYERHPEMFRDKEEVKEVIDKVVSEPEIIVDANKNNESYAVIKAAKRLNSEKMADVVIKNEGGINEVFHANKKRMKEFNRLKNKENLLQVETPTPSTHQLNGLGLIDKNLSGANALSAMPNDIISKAADGGDALSLHTAGQAYTGANVVSSTLSSTSNDIIPQNTTSLGNKTNIAVSESTLKRMQQRIAEVAKKGKSYTKDKNNDKDR